VQIDYQAELRNLSILNEIGHPNIVELLVSYTHGDKHNLIFPLAQEGDLQSFLQGPRPVSFASDETFLEALCGLASGIEKVHYYTLHRLNIDMIGCHHDLKPKNILVSGKAFVLSDFGISKFKDVEEDSKSTFEHGGGDYLAPECETHTTSRPSDIWSFGCIILEVLIYMNSKDGPQAVADFKKARREKVGNRWNKAFHSNEGLRDAVRKTVLELREFGTTGQLFFELVSSMLEKDPTARPDARRVLSSLRFIYIRSLLGLISKRYERIRRHHSQVFEAYVELERHKSWALTFESACDPSDRWSHALDQRLNIWAIVTALKRALEELDSIISRSEDAVSPLFTGLNLANDQLLETLTPELQVLSRTRWELSMLQSENVDELERTQRQIGKVGYGDNMNAMAKLKRKSILAAEALRGSTSGLALDTKLLVRPRRFGEHTIATMQSKEGIGERPVIIEWIHYRRYETQSMPVLSERVEALASLLNSDDHPEQLRILRCLGFIHDVSNDSQPAFGLVYGIPASANVKIRNLSEVISDTARITPRPTLEARLRLAYTLARSLSTFHKLGWLHKSISAYNVLLFNSPGSSSSAWLDSPYLVGFNHSRQKDPLAFTVGPTTNPAANRYHHPQYLRMQGQEQPQYRLEFDHFSLGLVLLEIGLWKPLETLTKDMKGKAPEARINLLCTSRVPLLGHQMGTAYERAVLACLKGVGEADPKAGDTKVESTSEQASALQLAFVAQVLEPLQKLQLLTTMPSWSDRGNRSSNSP
jgi:serine/threonine protein kinase